MKNYLLLLTLVVISSVTLHAQSLENFVPRDAIAIVEANGNQIFNLIDIKEIQDFMPPGPTGEPGSLDDYGINLRSKAYYFYSKKDEIAYQNLVVSLSSADKAAELVMSIIPNEPVTEGNFKYVSEGGLAAGWSNSLAVFTSVDFPKKVYTMADLLREKAAEKEAQQGEENDMSEDMAEEEDSGFMDEDSGENLEFELMMKNFDAPPLYSEDEMTSIMMQNFKQIVNSNPSQSIKNDARYAKGRKNDASAYLWMSNLDNLMQEAFAASLASMPGGLPSSIVDRQIPSGMDFISSNLIFDKDEIRVESDFGLRSDVASVYEEIYSGKMDKSFLNHFDENDVLSYMSFSSDMTKTLQAYPNLIKSLYGPFMPEFHEEISLAADVLGVFLDEEAIGELMTGDGLLVLHNLENREVTYMATEYDADFNAVEVEKTKNEPLPVFSVMIGSENQDIMTKLMALTRKHNLSSVQGSYHRVPVSEMMGAPFDVYFTHNDGIFYLTNSTTKIGNYVTGKKTKNPGSHKKKLRNNAYNLYVNSASIVESLGDILPPSMTDMAKSNFKEFYLISDKVEDNRMGMDMIFKTSSNKENTLQMLLDIFTSTMKGI